MSTVPTLSSEVPEENATAASVWVWSIADIERETGLGKDTLRVWEKRYGFPTPQRGAKQERLYNAGQLAQLRLIKNLLDNGARPHQVVGLPLSQLQARCAAQVTRVPASAGPPSLRLAEGETALHDDVCERCLSALEQGHTAQLRHLLEQLLLRYGLVHTIEQYLSPLCVAVGNAWVQGRVSIYHEHLFTELVQALLGEAMASIGQQQAVLQHPPHRPRVLLTTTPGEPHQLGMRMAECFFAQEGCHCLTLGPCTPVADIAQAQQQLQADVVALSFSAYSVRKDVLSSLSALRQMLPSHVPIWVGGAAVALRRKGLPDGVTVLGRASAIAGALAQWRLQRQTGPHTDTDAGTV